MASPTLLLLFTATLLLSSYGYGASESVSSSSAEKRNFAVDLTAVDFDAVLRDTPASYAIVEFYAHWCPACRNYKPHYEKVARLFNGVDAVHPGILLLTRVDCALKVNIDLCDRFSVNHYPMLFWGKSSEFVNGNWSLHGGIGEMRPIDNGRTHVQLLNWINIYLNSMYGFDDEKKEESVLLTNVTNLGQVQIS
ncbi:PREDICTED: sulfhydryl oxidase 2-like isoform X1 [Ipomoea nil]|uniref:sulfhydryl oxidase 2-like isoform X1 n=1 Tax=Ipomoea nil TaxID=35883 RepID=UPI00090189D7|nr:PREDICTED: sulfhydryl oxidase 2-like isoform X1 [Ipomoea nil]XP_019160204.1 PREDICTED: sulfhydryl oxidase 2-like isoform X1 [Ipomoea nil]